MATLSKLIYSLRAAPSKPSWPTSWSKISYGLRISKTDFQKNPKAGGLTFPDFRTYYEATGMKTVWYQHKYRHRGKWNRVESKSKPRAMTVDWLSTRAQGNSKGKSCLQNGWLWGDWTRTGTVGRRPSVPQHVQTLAPHERRVLWDLSVNAETARPLGGERRESLWPRVRQSLLKYDTKDITDKRKK